MGNFVVFNNLDWVPPVKSQLLTAPKVKISVLFPDDDLKEMVDKQRKAFDEEFKKFDAEFNKLGTSKIKAIQDAINWTEERIKQKPKAERQAVADTANKMLASAFLTFQDEIRALAQLHFDKSVEKSCSVMKMKLVKAKAKAIAKITIVVLLTLTAAALAIAATVATGGVAAPVIIGAIVAGASALWSAYKTVGAGWASASNQMKVIAKDTETLKAAAGKLQELKALGSTGDKKALDGFEKLKALLSGKMVDLAKHVGQLYKYIFEVSKAIDKQNADMVSLTKRINESGDSKLRAQANTLSRKLMASIGALRAMGDVKDEAAKVKSAWDATKTIDLGKFELALRRVDEAAPFIIEVAQSGKALFDGAKGLAAALK